jgi:hypothetical protein
MKRGRSHGFDWDDFPVIGGQGSLHDLAPPAEPTPRLAGMRSVSRAAAYALAHKPEHRPNPIGFHSPRKR